MERHILAAKVLVSTMDGTMDGQGGKDVRTGQVCEIVRVPTLLIVAVASQSHDSAKGMPTVNGRGVEQEALEGLRVSLARELVVPTASKCAGIGLCKGTR